MAKSMTVGKRENEKKRIAKREEKLKKKENKKLSGSSNSFEDMIAYVDENGRITSTPPTENVRKEEINPDEIVIATPKKEDEEPTILRGRVEFFNESRGFGFIKDLSGERVPERASERRATDRIQRKVRTSIESPRTSGRMCFMWRGL